jgi:hypothetical protein
MNKVIPDDFDCPFIPLHKYYPGGTTAQGFDPHVACTGVKIQEVRAGNPRTQDIKQGFFNPVGSGSPAPSPGNF